MNGPPDALVRSASTEIAAHGVVDLFVGRLLVLHEQRRGGHDLPGLAVAALRDVLRLPGALQRMRAVWREPFDGEDLLPRHVLERRAAGADRLSVRQHGARAAEAAAAAEFRS